MRTVSALDGWSPQRCPVDRNGTVWAHVPAQIDKSGTRWTWSSQCGLAVWTEDKLGIDCPLASRAQWQIVEILEKILLLQRTLKCLVQCLLRSQDEIEQQSRNKEQHDQKRRKDLREDASASGLDIPECPGNEGKPEGYEVGDPNRKQKLSASCGGLDHEPCPLDQQVLFGVAARLSVPDALEPSDRKDENTRASGALFGRTRDPEFGLTGKGPQRFDPSRPPAGPRPHKCQDVAHLIVIDADDQCR